MILYILGFQTRVAIIKKKYSTISDTVIIIKSKIQYSIFNIISKISKVLFISNFVLYSFSIMMYISRDHFHSSCGQYLQMKIHTLYILCIYMHWRCYDIGIYMISSIYVLCYVTYAFIKSS